MNTLNDRYYAFWKHISLDVTAPPFLHSEVRLSTDDGTPLWISNQYKIPVQPEKLVFLSTALSVLDDIHDIMNGQAKLLATAKESYDIAAKAILSELSPAADWPEYAVYYDETDNNTLWVSRIKDVVNGYVNVHDRWLKPEMLIAASDYPDGLWVQLRRIQATFEQAQKAAKTTTEKRIESFLSELPDAVLRLPEVSLC